MARKTAGKQARLASQLIDLSLAAPTVVAARLGKVAKGGANPDRRTRAEIRKMSQEKVAATTESWAAIAFSGARLGHQLMALSLAAVWQPQRHPPANLAVRAAALTYNALLDGSNAGVEPYRKRARSNARRLTAK